MSTPKSPTWADIELPSFPKLENNLTTDVAIAGGGLVGLLTAYLLGKEGKKVVILEKDKVGQGATGMTTAFLTQIIDTNFTQAIDIYGKEDTQLIVDSHGKAIDLIEQIVNDEKIDCEFMRCTNYSYINEDSEREDLQKEFEAMQQLFREVTLHKEGNDKRLGFHRAGYINLPNQAKFHPTKFLKDLIEALKKFDVQIFGNTEVTEVEPGKITAGDLTVEAEYVITATYDPIGNPIQTFMKKGMYVSYVYELEMEASEIPEAIYEDFNNPYHYFRVDRTTKDGPARIIIGGEDNRKEIALDSDKNFAALKEYIDKVFEGEEYKIVRKWTGPILEPSDGLPLIGELKDKHLIATAFSGNGMTYSGISAIMFRDIIMSKPNPWTKIYDPSRFPSVEQLASKLKDYAGEFVHGVVKNIAK